MAGADVSGEPLPAPSSRRNRACYSRRTVADPLPLLSLFSAGIPHAANSCGLCRNFMSFFIFMELSSVLLVHWCRNVRCFLSCIWSVFSATFSVGLNYRKFYHGVYLLHLLLRALPIIL